MKTLIVEGNPGYPNEFKTHISSFCCKYILLAISFFSLVTPAHALDISLHWYGNSEWDLAGYKLYYKIGPSGDPYYGTSIDQGTSPITLVTDDLNGANGAEYTPNGLDQNEICLFSITAYNDASLVLRVTIPMRWSLFQ